MIALAIIMLFSIAGLLSIHRRWLDSLHDEIRTLMWSHSQSNDAGLREVADALERLSIILIYHDATVRGTNPEALGSTEELLKTLRGRKV